MFSSGEMVHLVFANESDTYYGSDLLQLDLNQYLWARLHETEAYKTVYFLSMRDGEIAVRSFGDKNAKLFQAKKGWFGGKKVEKELRGWLEDRLVTKSGKAASAVVCNLEEFCRAFSDESNLDFLRELSASPKRSGVLVLTAPPVVEKTKDLLLNSPVFEAVKDTGVLSVREGEQVDLFAALRRGKGESSVFLNTFTRERVRDLLMQATFRGTDRFMEEEDFEAAADYLFRYMNAPLLRQREPLFGNGMLNWNYRYRDLYQELMKADVWNRLVSQSARARQMGTLAEYPLEEGEVGVVREKDSAAGRCQQLWLPRKLAECELRGEAGWQILADIRREARRVSPRDDNPKVAGVIPGFLAELDQVRDLDDSDTCLRLLICLRFCLRQLALPISGEEEKVFADRLSSMDEYIQASKNYFFERKNLLLQQQSGGKIAGYLLQQHKDSLMAAQSLLSQYEDLIGTFINEILYTPESSVSDLADRLKKELISEQSSSEPSEPEQTDAAEQEEPAEIEYTLRLEDYGFLPE